MRVLVWTEAFWPAIGGLEAFLMQLVTSLHDTGHEVLVITGRRSAHEPAEDVYQGVPVRRVDLYEVLRSRRPERILGLRRTVAQWVSAFEPDLIHINLVGPGAALLVGDGTWPAPAVVSIHGAIRNLRLAGPDTLLGRTLTAARWITACSTQALESVLQLAPDIRRKSSVIRYGIALPADMPPPVEFNPPHVVGVGRLVAMKGFDVAVDAIARLRRDFPTIRLTIGGDGSERGALEDRARAAGVGELVRFTGWLPPEDALALMGRSTLVVVPSRDDGVEYAEGLGIVALEAAAMGRAVVATRSGGLVEAVADGVTGTLVPAGDPDALAAAIAARLRDEPGTIAMGRTGRDRVLREFGWPGCFNAFLALFFRLLESA